MISPVRAYVVVMSVALVLALSGCGRIDELEAQVAELESELDEKQQQIEQLKQENDDLNMKVESIGDALNGVDSDLETVERITGLLPFEVSFYVRSAVRDLRASFDAAKAEAD